MLSSMGPYESQPWLGPADVSNPISVHLPLLPFQLALMKCMGFVFRLGQPSAFAHWVFSAWLPIPASLAFPYLWSLSEVSAPRKALLSPQSGSVPCLSLYSQNALWTFSLSTRICLYNHFSWHAGTLWGWGPCFLLTGPHQTPVD